MGSPDFPSREQQAALRKAAELPPPVIAKVVDGHLSLSLQPNALAVIEFSGFQAGRSTGAGRNKGALPIDQNA